ncbi:MAG: hypothetical protein V4581_14400 [Bacteroidota bacterium]
MNAKTDAIKKDETVKNLPTEKKAETPKIDLQKKETELRAILNPTAEQRIKNMKNFSVLSERYEQLIEKQDELNTFVLSSDGTQERFKLSNVSGYAFEFTNTQVIDEVIEVARKHLDARIEKTKQEILEFSI